MVIGWEKRPSKHVWHKMPANEDQQDLIVDLIGKPDTYISVNEFNGWRRINLLKSLRACYVDLDFERQIGKVDLDAVIDLLHKKKMPQPSMIVYSGRGMHLYWLIEPAGRERLPLWQRVQNALVESLTDMHSDPKARDCTRVLRLVDTVNSKNKEKVHGMVFDDQPWTLNQLADEVLGVPPPRKPTVYHIGDLPNSKPKAKSKAKVRSIDAARVKRGDHPKASIHRRWDRVLSDLHTIGRHYRQIPQGYRNEFLFIASVALSWFASADSIADEVVDMARLYCSDITDAEAALAASQSIERATKAAGGQVMMWQGQPSDLRYYFKRSTLWQRLGVLAAPVSHLLRAIITDEQAAQHEQERQTGRDRVKEGRYKDHNTKQGCRQGNADKAAQAHVLRAAGMSQSVIAVELGVSKMTVSRWCNNIAPLVQPLPLPPKGLGVLQVHQLQAGEPKHTADALWTSSVAVVSGRPLCGAAPPLRRGRGGCGVGVGVYSTEPDSRLALAA
jgi:DNA-binding transcriptional regulator YiaG